MLDYFYVQGGGLLKVVRDRWSATGGPRQVVRDRWSATGGPRQVVCDYFFHPHPPSFLIWAFRTNVVHLHRPHSRHPTLFI